MCVRGLLETCQQNPLFVPASCWAVKSSLLYTGEKREEQRCSDVFDSTLPADNHIDSSNLNFDEDEGFIRGMPATISQVLVTGPQ